MGFGTIFFDDATIQMLLDGKKTQTRRVVKNVEKLDKCPYGKVGEILSVKETWYANEDGTTTFKVGSNVSVPKWNSPYVMPKARARLKLRVTEIKHEKLHDITTDDCAKEGTEASVESYKQLWNNINVKKGIDWDKNPLVWVISFEVVKE